MRLDTMDDRPRWRRLGPSDSSERPPRPSHGSFSLIHRDADADINADSHSESDWDTDTESDWDIDAYDNGYTDRDTRARLHTVKLGHADAHTQSHTLRELHTDTHLICYIICDADRNTDPDSFSSDWRITFRHTY